MAITFLTGFECGLVTSNGNGLYAPAGAAGSIVTTAPRNGARHWRGSGISGSSMAAILPLPTSGTEITLGFGFRMATMPTSGNKHTVVMLRVAGTGDLRIMVTSAGVMQLVDELGTVLDTGPTITSGTWHWVDLKYEVNTANHPGEWKVDGVDQGSFTYTGGTTTTMNSGGTVILGDSRDTYPSAFDFYVDDVIVSDSNADYPIGDSKIISILPGSDGTHSFTTNDFSTGDAGTQRAPSYTSFFDMVNDAPPWSTTRSTTDNIAQRVVRSTGYVELAPDSASSLTGETAIAVRALIGYSSSGTAANSAACIVRNSAGSSATLWGSTTAIGGASSGEADYSESSNFFKGAIVLKPIAGWTESEIDAIRWRFGAAADVSPIPTLQLAMLEVAYPTSTTTYVDGAVTLAASAVTIAADGTREKVGAATLATTAVALSVSATREKVASATLATTAVALTVSGAREKIASATLATTAVALSVSGAREVDASATLAISTALTAAATTEHFVNADAGTLTASVALSASAQRDATGSATISIAPTLAAAAERTANVSATLANPVSIASSAERDAVATATIATPVSIAAAGAADLNASATLSITVSIFASANNTLDGAATLAISTALTASGVLEAVGSATVSVTVGLAASAERTANASATLAIGSAISVSANADLSASATLHVGIGIVASAVVKPLLTERPQAEQDAAGLALRAGYAALISTPTGAANRRKRKWGPMFGQGARR